MAVVSAIREVRGPLPTVERLWYDVGRWASFVDGFAHVVKVEGGWPGSGSRLVWQSTPAGRGRVVERVVEHEAGVGQVLEVEDPQLEGTQRVRFETRRDGISVALQLDYRLKRGGPVQAVVDLVFIRRALRESMQRTLAAFSREVDAELELPR